MGDLSDRMTGERNLPDYHGRPFYGPARNVRVEVAPKTDLTPARVDAILAALKPAENPDDYFMDQPDPGPDRDNQFIHKLLLWHWDEYDTYDEVAERVRGQVKLLADEGRLANFSPAVGQVLEAMKRLNDEERRQIMSEFCRACGSEDPRCQCWNDE